MKVRAFIIFLIIIIIISYLSYINVFESMNNKMSDFFYQSKKNIDSRIIIIKIDDKSIEQLGRWQDWSRSYFAQAVNIISKGKPAVIGIDIMFPSESANSEEDINLVRATDNAGNIVVPVKGLFNRISGKKHIEAVKVEKPFKDLESVSLLGHINSILDKDNVVRHSLLRFKHKDTTYNSFSFQIYNTYQKYMNKKINIQIPVDKWNRFYINYSGKPGDYESYSFINILNNEIPCEYFKDKIILIGPYSEGMLDSYLTSISSNEKMNGVEIHANIIQSMLYNNFKKEVKDYINILFVVILSLLSYIVYRKLSPLLGALCVIIISILYIIIAKTFYDYGMVIHILYPIIGIVLFYILQVIYEYFEEYVERKRVTDIFGKYVAPQVVDKILDGGEDSLKLGGVRKQITVLFVDIRGFTPLSEKCQPEEVVSILNEYLNLCAKSIFNNNGTLDKFIGDATMAIFNAPIDDPDHAYNAIKTAMQMKEGSMELEKNLEEKYGLTVKFGIGINTGYAVVGNIGAKFRMDYTAIGDTVNTSARLESNAKAGQILLSKSSYELVKNMVKTRSLGEIKVKGKSKGIQIYELEEIIGE